LLALTGTGAAGALAGCTLPFTGGSDGSGDGNSGGGDGGDGGGTPTPTPPPISEAIEFVEGELQRNDAGTLMETVTAQGTARNTSDIRLTEVQVRITFLNEDGEQLATQSTDPRSVASSAEFTYSVQFPGNGSEAAAVADFEPEAGTGFGGPEGTATQ
jgi:hypothetical protein